MELTQLWLFWLHINVYVDTDEKKYPDLSLEYDSFFSKHTQLLIYFIIYELNIKIVQRSIKTWKKVYVAYSHKFFSSVPKFT